MRAIVIKIRVNAPASGSILNDISKVLERFLKRKHIEYHSIDVAAKLDENE